MERYNGRDRSADQYSRSKDGGTRGSWGGRDYDNDKRNSRQSNHFHSANQSGSRHGNLARSGDRMAVGYPGRNDDYRTPVKRRRSSENQECPVGPRKYGSRYSQGRMIGLRKILRKLRGKLGKMLKDSTKKLKS